MASRQFAKLLTSILERRDLTTVDKLLFAILRDRSNPDGLVSIGVRRLANLLVVKPDTLQRAASNLEAVGLLLQVRRGRGRRNQYRVTRNPEKCIPNRDTSESGVYPKSGHGVPPIGTLVYPESGHVSDSEDIQRGSRTVRTKSESPHHKVIEHFTASWGKRFGGSYPFDSKKDPSAVKRILESVGGNLDRAKHIVDAYLRDTDAYLGRRGSPAGVGVPVYLEVQSNDKTEGAFD